MGCGGPGGTGQGCGGPRHGGWAAADPRVLARGGCCTGWRSAAARPGWRRHGLALGCRPAEAAAAEPRVLARGGCCTGWRSASARLRHGGCAAAGWVAAARAWLCHDRQS